DDMADLVAEYRGEFVFRIHQREQASGDVDVAAGDGEGVDHVRVDHREGALARHAGRARHAFAGRRDIVRQRPFDGAAELSQDLWVLLTRLRALAGGDLRRIRR